MNVFFTTPYAGKKHYQSYIDAIIKIIEDDHHLTTPEDSKRYLKVLGKLQKQALKKNQAHYAFIRQGIASADVVIIEATQEDIRVGHEMTLALLFHKPTLILSQDNDFGDYITHDLLVGKKYTSIDELKKIVKEFLDTSQVGRAESTMQTLDTSADSLHSIALVKLRQLAKQEPGQFGEWARKADREPEAVAKEIESKLGKLKKHPAWSVFAPIYNEDSPDYIQAGVAKFVDSVLQTHSIKKDDEIVEAACGTAALSRQLAVLGYKKLKAFDSSRPMLSEAFRLSADYPVIEISESDILTLDLARKTSAIIWIDYSSNFALTFQEFKKRLVSLISNLVVGGILIFDVRTYQGWQIDFYAQPITMFATDRFQRIWLNHQDHKNRTITFDVYIRTRDVDGAWTEWQRESMTEKMWRLSEVISTVKDISETRLEATYRDDFREINVNEEEPNLAYLVLRKVE